MSNITIDELISRQKRMQAYLKNEDVDGVLILQDIDLFYFANSMQLFAAYLPREGNIIVFYKNAKEKIASDCPFELQQAENFKDITTILKNFNLFPIKKLGIEFDVLPIKIFKRVMSAFNDAIEVDISESIKKVKMIKSEFEIRLMRQAAKITTEVFNEIPNIIKPGISELDLAIEIEYLYRKKNHLGPTRMRSFNHELFFGHVVSGVSSMKHSSFDSPLGGEGIHSAYSIGASKKSINKNETIVIDYVSNYNGYHIDTTRTFVIGVLPDELIKNYENLKKVYNKIRSLIKPDINCREIYFDIIKFVDTLGLTENFMGYKEDKVKFVGHGIGIEIDEYPIIAPRFDMKLEKNMVVAFEPKMFFEPDGAIGLEDTFLITENGHELLVSLDEELICI